jgi:hypothetical protein
LFFRVRSCIEFLSPGFREVIAFFFSFSRTHLLVRFAQLQRENSLRFSLFFSLIFFIFSPWFSSVFVYGGCLSLSVSVSGRGGHPCMEFHQKKCLKVPRSWLWWWCWGKPWGLLTLSFVVLFGVSQFDPVLLCILSLHWNFLL